MLHLDMMCLLTLFLSIYLCLRLFLPLFSVVLTVEHTNLQQTVNYFCNCTRYNPIGFIPLINKDMLYVTTFVIIIVVNWFNIL